MTTSNKCIVKGCNNHHHEGRFQTFELCAPCYEMITTGNLSSLSGNTFIHKLWVEKESNMPKICCGNYDMKSCPNCVPALQRELKNQEELATQRRKFIRNASDFLMSCP